MKTRLKRFENDFTLLSSITVVSGGGQLTTPMTSFNVIGVGERDSKWNADEMSLPVYTALSSATLDMNFRLLPAQIPSLLEYAESTRRQNNNKTTMAKFASQRLSRQQNLRNCDNRETARHPSTSKRWDTQINGNFWVRTFEALKLPSAILQQRMTPSRPPRSRPPI